jgi:hypothetical protein
MELLKNWATDNFFAKLILNSVAVLFYSYLVRAVIITTKNIFKIDWAVVTIKG